MRQRRDRFRLALEARQRIGIVRDGLRQDLDRDVAVELPVPRLVHLAHAARAERRQDLVGAEFRAGRETHEAPATSFWNRGFLRSGSKLGSILSHAGVR